MELAASLTGVLSPHKKSPSSTMVLPSSPVKVPETDPIDVAAHLQLLGESLSLIGHRLQETEVGAFILFIAVKALSISGIVGARGRKNCRGKRRGKFPISLSRISS